MFSYHKLGGVTQIHYTVGLVSTADRLSTDALCHDCITL